MRNKCGYNYTRMHRIVLRSENGRISEQMALCGLISNYSLNEIDTIRCAGKDAIIGLMTAMGIDPRRTARVIEIFSPRKYFMNMLCSLMIPVWSEIMRGHIESIMENDSNLTFAEFGRKYKELELYSSIMGGGSFYSVVNTPDMRVSDAVCEVLCSAHTGECPLNANYTIVLAFNKVISLSLDDLAVVKQNDVNVIYLDVSDCEDAFAMGLEQNTTFLSRQEKQNGGFIVPEEEEEEDRGEIGTGEGRVGAGTQWWNAKNKSGSENSDDSFVCV